MLEKIIRYPVESEVDNLPKLKNIQLLPKHLNTIELSNAQTFKSEFLSR